MMPKFDCFIDHILREVNKQYPLCARCQSKSATHTVLTSELTGSGMLLHRTLWVCDSCGRESYKHSNQAR